MPSFVAPNLPQAPPTKEDKGWCKQNSDWRARCTSGSDVGGEIEMWLVRDNSQSFKQP
jgi:hypothetical protein